MEIKTRLATLSAKEIGMFLNDKRAEVGRLATLNADGFPYIVPVHFIYLEGKIYVHGAQKGQKIQNIINNPKVGFEIDVMDEIIPNNMPCMANTTFTSAIVTGNAVILADAGLKQKVLNLFVEKYLPPGEYTSMPPKVIDVTSVIEITIVEITAKSRIIEH